MVQARFLFIPICLFLFGILLGYPINTVVAGEKQVESISLSPSGYDNFQILKDDQRSLWFTMKRTGDLAQTSVYSLNVDGEGRDALAYDKNITFLPQEKVKRVKVDIDTTNLERGKYDLNFFVYSLTAEAKAQDMQGVTTVNQYGASVEFEVVKSVKKDLFVPAVQSEFSAAKLQVKGSRRADEELSLTWGMKNDAEYPLSHVSFRGEFLCGETVLGGQQYRLDDLSLKKTTIQEYSIARLSQCESGQYTFRLYSCKEGYTTGCENPMLLEELAFESNTTESLTDRYLVPVIAGLSVLLVLLILVVARLRRR